MEVKEVKEAYHKLWSKIKEPEGQIVWCYTDDRYIPRTGVLKMLWALEIPEDQIICRIDDIAWNKIIGRKGIALPRRLKGEWDRLPKSGDWWDELIVRENAIGYLRSAIVRHPVPAAWVAEKYVWRAK